MKQLAVLMALLLAVMLLITGVMAVGNARQSEQMAEKSRQVSSLKADLRTAKKENKTLSTELESCRERILALLSERQAVVQRLSRALALLPEGAAGQTDPVLPKGQTAAGEALLKAAALEQALRRSGGRPPVQAGAISWAVDTGGAQETAVPEVAANTGAVAATAADVQENPADAGVAADVQVNPAAVPEAPITDATPMQEAAAHDPLPRTTAGSGETLPSSASGTVAAVSQVVELPVAGPRPIVPGDLLSLLKAHAQRMLYLLDGMSGLLRWVSGQ